MGQVRLCILANRRRQPERGFSVTFLIVPVAKLRVFPIRYTYQPSATPATNSIITTFPITRVVGGTGRENPYFVSIIGGLF